MASLSSWNPISGDEGAQDLLIGRIPARKGRQGNALPP